MNRAFLLFFLLPLQALATNFTEFYVQTTGANTNAGSTTANSAPFSFVSGNWTNTTATFFKSGIDLSSVTTNMWASVYADGAAVTAYVAQIVAVDDANDTIQLSTSAFAGTNPTDNTGSKSISIGGAWAGPSGTTLFPFGFATATLTNRSSNSPRVNFKSGVEYTNTAVITHSLAGPIRFQGYTTNPGDLGKATLMLNLASPGGAHVTLSGANIDFADFIGYSNGSGGTLGSGFALSGIEGTLLRCACHDYRQYGIRVEGVGSQAIGCEAYANNKSNGVSTGGYFLNANAVMLFYCIAHDNTTANAHGFVIGSTTSAFLYHCIGESNTKDGLLSTTAQSTTAIGCDFYNNDIGVDLSSASTGSVLLVNCNFVKNTTYGISSSGTLTGRNGIIHNCGFGAGTQANGTDIIAGLQGVNVLGSITYANDMTPWVDPANGDFRINLAAAKNGGYGTFTETAATYAGTVAYPDVGAAQHLDSTTASPARSFPIFQ